MSRHVASIEYVDETLSLSKEYTNEVKTELYDKIYNKTSSAVNVLEENNFLIINDITPSSTLNIVSNSGVGVSNGNFVPSGFVKDITYQYTDPTTGQINEKTVVGINPKFSAAESMGYDCLYTSVKVPLGQKYTLKCKYHNLDYSNRINLSIKPNGTGGMEKIVNVTPGATGEISVTLDATSIAAKFFDIKFYSNSTKNKIASNCIFYDIVFTTEDNIPKTYEECPAGTYKEYTLNELANTIDSPNYSPVWFSGTTSNQALKVAYEVDMFKYFASKQYVDEKIGDIELVLDAIISAQNDIIGG
jgi:hypothetical protein